MDLDVICTLWTLGFQVLLGLRDSSELIASLSLHALAEMVPVLGRDVVIGGKSKKYFREGRPKVFLSCPWCLLYSVKLLFWLSSLILLENSCYFQWINVSISETISVTQYKFVPLLILYLFVWLPSLHIAVLYFLYDNYLQYLCGQ